MNKGDKVEWNYAGHKAEGIVAEVHNEDVSRKIQGKQVKRKGSAEKPALVIRQGKKKVVKSASEVKVK
jgi:hypothetical protein